MSKRELPQGWTSAALGEVLPLSYGKALAERLRDATGQVSVFGSSGIVGVHGAALVDSPSIIVGRKGSAGAVHLASGPSWPIDTAYYCIPPKGIDLRWAYYRLLSLNLAHLDQSTAIPSLSRDDYSRIVVALPPSAEQERIVAAIDALFTRLEAAESELDKAAALSRKFRQSYLAAGTTGVLTADWRDARKLGPWSTSTIGELFKVHVGSTPKRSVPEYWGGNVSWVSSGEIRFNRIAETRELITERGLKETRLKIHPPGTVLMAMIGEGKTRGQAAILDIPACHNQNSVAIDVRGSGVAPEYLYYCLCAKYEENRRLSSGGNQPALSGQRVRSIPINVPQKAEMNEAVSRMANLEVASEDIANSIAAFRSQLEGLRQSILSRAFRGELVPQDSNDEPAERLLERMRSHRAAGSPPPKRVPRKPRKAAA